MDLDAVENQWLGLKFDYSAPCIRLMDVGPWCITYASKISTATEVMARWTLHSNERDWLRCGGYVEWQPWKSFPRMTPSGACFPNNTWDNISGELWNNAELILDISEISPINRYGSTVAKFLTVHHSEKVVWMCFLHCNVENSVETQP